MLAKIAVLFLLVMAALALFGRLRMPKLRRGGGVARCPDCGRPLVGKTPCSCSGGKA
jgi:hypothetical protein